MGVARKELIEAALSACRRCMEEIGFTQHAGEFFTLPLAHQMFGWVGLGRAIHHGNGALQIEPTVGLLHQGVEQLISRLAHLPYHRYYPATIQTIVGQLMPQATYLRVEFYPGQSVEIPARSICNAIANYGVPWMNENASLTAIYDLVVSGRFTVPLQVFKLPVIACLLGRPELARQHLRTRLIHIKEEGGRNAEGSLEVYERFASALEIHMSDPKNSPERQNNI